jgi:IS5 family transposase
MLQPFFAQADLYRGAIPDETTILNFRRLLEINELAPENLTRVNAYPTRKGLILKRGSSVDAIIAAPSLTKNAEGRRDPRRTDEEGQSVALVPVVVPSAAVRKSPGTRKPASLVALRGEAQST